MKSTMGEQRFEREVVRNSAWYVAAQCGLGVSFLSIFTGLSISIWRHDKITMVQVLWTRIWGLRQPGSDITQPTYHQSRLLYGFSGTLIQGVWMGYQLYSGLQIFQHSTLLESHTWVNPGGAILEGVNCFGAWVLLTSDDRDRRFPLWDHQNMTSALEGRGRVREFQTVHGSTNRRATGFVNFVLALAYHFCLNLPAAFTQPEACLLVEPCTITPPTHSERVSMR